ncbi:energy transducer TonB [Pedobacter sandarakinus]|uniref:energy transducer TonB n=1 Tax=Pedobacter sandarakinus TaxID=353156 RepID=UPI002247F44C|nr:energy transducer TonB [Pedobacter sandarakinus]MCX2575120.1 energy transducer TonB [Pedobacter sandarakinus]
MFNSSFNVYKTEWLDLVFANRNKTYGAYQLRSKSSSIMTRALFITSGFFLLVAFAPLVYSKIYPTVVEEVAPPTVVDLSNVIHDMKKKVEPEKKPEPQKAEPVKVKTVNMTSNIVVVDKPELKDPPTMKEIENAMISNITQEGEIKPNLVLNTVTNAGNGDGLGKQEGTGADEGVIDLGGVDEYPEFAGGMKAFTRYMERNLRYPSQAQDQGVVGKVFLSFVVEKDGSITDVKVLRGIGFGCDEEAIKVIKKSPLWKPGKNRGVPVRVRYNMPINFQIM